ncbi:MAG: tyrosine-type recombinase/integrase [Planctomycetes bacterium]|nr:tyrosine-type recombinase/integrase [Planctomycetota bacterium]
MPREKASARVLKWRGEHYLFYRDHATGKNKRVLCASLDATNAEDRAELVKEYRLNEKLDETEVVRRGGRLAYDTPLTDAIGLYLKNCEKRVQSREKNPEARAGLSDKSGVMISKTIGHFTDWLKLEGHGALTTGALDARLLSAYFQDLAQEKTRRGKASVRRSAATLNLYRRNLKACLSFLDDLRPPVFPDYKPLKKPLKPQRVELDMPKAFSPKELTGFLKAALEWESPKLKVSVRRRKPSGKREEFDQAPPVKPSTPVSRLFLILALTGCRLGEALGLKWEDVDLDRGRLTIHAQKTGRTRVLPLVGAPEGDVSPGLLGLLKAWREAAPKAVYVLPHDKIEAPAFPKSGWQMVNQRAKLERIGPQMLRQNFTSYAASLGVPSTVAALWQGHSAGVAERHYRAQVLDRNLAATMDEAMGLAPMIESIATMDEAARLGRTTARRKLLEAT